MQQLAPGNFGWSNWVPFRRYSLRDIMFRFTAETLVDIGENIQEGKLLLDRLAGVTIEVDDSRQYLYQAISDVSEASEELAAPWLHAYLKAKVDAFEDAPPSKWEDLEGYADLFKGLLKERLFLYVPPEQAMFWQRHDALSEDAHIAFPSIAHELLSAGNAYACGLSTASVFHAMRALEVGLRAMAEDVGLVWTREQWHTIIEAIEFKIKALRATKQSPTRDVQLHAMSLAAKEFFYFKDGWRNYVSHGRHSYEQPQAAEVLDHVRAFAEHLAREVKLKEVI